MDACRKDISADKIPRFLFDVTQKVIIVLKDI